MKKFHKRRGVIITQLSAYEVELLASLIMQLVELLSDGEPAGFATQSEPSDAFDEIVKNLEGESGRARTTGGSSAQTAFS